MDFNYKTISRSSTSFQHQRCCWLVALLLALPIVSGTWPNRAIPVDSVVEIVQLTLPNNASYSHLVNPIKIEPFSVLVVSTNLLKNFAHIFDRSSLFHLFPSRFFRRVQCNKNKTSLRWEDKKQHYIWVVLNGHLPDSTRHPQNILLLRCYAVIDIIRIAFNIYSIVHDSEHFWHFRFFHSSNFIMNF